MGASLFKGGKIRVELAGGNNTFIGGQQINGTVFVEQTDPFQAKGLVVSFVGSEHTFFDESNDKTRVHYRNNEVITKLDFNLLDLEQYQNQCQIGKFQFPFCFEVPHGLQPSFFSSERWFGKVALFQYAVRAQFIPVDDKNLFKLNKNEMMSTYMGWTEVIIRTDNPLLPPMLSEPIVAGHQKQLKTGFLGLGGKQTASFTVEMPKDTFALGETATMRVFSDNTSCDKAMEAVKIKLECKVDVTATETGFGAWTKTKQIGPIEVHRVLGQIIPAKEKFQ